MSCAHLSHLKRASRYVVLALIGLSLALSSGVGCTIGAPRPSDYSRGRQSELGRYPSPPMSAVPGSPAVRGVNTPQTPLSDLVDPSARPSLDEEVWVIARNTPNNDPPQPREPMPGTGAMVTKVPDQAQPVPVPLKHTDVKAAVAGYVATVDVTQQFHNPYASKIEAVYVFPLPQDAAVNEFVMTIGDRKIRGIIRERQQAQQIYDDAKRQGYVASLLTQERPNVFTQAVANIEPGKQIDVTIRYYHTLKYADGWYEWVFPMVVGPRFNPPGYTEGIGASPKRAGNGSGQPVDVQYLAPDQRSGHDIAVNLAIDAGTPIEAVESPSHQVVTQRPSPTRAALALSPGDSIPNKDLVVRFKVAGEKLKTAVVVQRDQQSTGGYFAVMLFPPETATDAPRRPLEMVFTVDVSGSMSGQPLDACKAALRAALTSMDGRDTFNVVTFAGDAKQLFPQAQPATRENLAKAIAFVDRQQGGGGTMMLEGVTRSFASPTVDGRDRVVAFMTDGLIGNEPQILQAVHTQRGDARLFSFGVGSAPNRYLLDNLARFGRGAVAYLGPQDDGAAIMRAYFDRVSRPAFADISLDANGLAISEVYPQRVPDLFAGRPVVIVGRFTGNPTGTLKLRGKVGTEERTIDVPLQLAQGEGTDAATHGGLRFVWARQKIAAISETAVYSSQDAAALPDKIKLVALEYGLMSQFTAFVAVDSSRRTEGESGTTVAVPVPVPEGVKYETTVGEK
jgi:Ca-activated chloride channel family protein